MFDATHRITHYPLHNTHYPLPITHYTYTEGPTISSTWRLTEKLLIQFALQ